MYRSTWMTVVLVLALPGSGALPLSLLGDAGSGADAGGSAAAAMPLAFGAYEANLTPGDEDWFRFPVTAAGSCVDVGLLTSHAMAISVASDGVPVLDALPSEAGVFATTLALPRGAPGVVARADELPWAAASVGPYSFELAPVAAVAIDARETASDAPDRARYATPLPASCIAGWLHHAGADVDVTTFAASAGELATVSLATLGGGGSATIADAAGTPLLTVAAGGAAQLVVPADGQYSFAIAGAPAADKYAYTAALVVGPPTQGCRPACLDV